MIGEKLRITHIGLGVDEQGQLTYNTEITGQLPETPELPPGSSVEPAQFRGECWRYPNCRLAPAWNLLSSEVSGEAGV